MKRISNEYSGHEFRYTVVRIPEDRKLVVRILARYGKLTRLQLLKRLYSNMMSFDLDRVLPTLEQEIKTEVVDGVTYYSLR